MFNTVSNHAFDSLRAIAAGAMGLVYLLTIDAATADTISSRTQNVKFKLSAQAAGLVHFNARQSVDLKTAALSAHAIQIDHTEMNRLKVKVLFDPATFSGPVSITTTFLSGQGSVLAEKTTFATPEKIAAGTIKPGFRHPNAPVLTQDFYTPSNKWVKWGKAQADFEEIPDLLKKIKSYEVRVDAVAEDMSLLKDQAAAH